MHVNALCNTIMLTLLGLLQVACVLSRNQNRNDESGIESCLQQLKRETFEVIHIEVNKFFYKFISDNDETDNKF